MQLTIEVPERLLQELRALSDQRGYSLDEAVIRMLQRGLGHAPAGDEPEESKPPMDNLPAGQELPASLGSFIARPATIRYDPDAVTRELAALGLDVQTYGLSEALEWTRGEQ